MNYYKYSPTLQPPHVTHPVTGSVDLIPDPTGHVSHDWQDEDPVLLLNVPTFKRY